MPLVSNARLVAKQVLLFSRNDTLPLIYGLTVLNPSFFTVYAMEAMQADGKTFHKGCMKCAECNGVLKLGKENTFSHILFEQYLFLG